MIKYVYFDFGGVLTESGKRGFIAQTLAQLYGQPAESLDIGEMHLALRRGTANEQVLFDKLNAQYSKQVTKEQFVALTNQSFAPSQTVYDMAARLRAAGIKTGILSNVFAMNAQDLRANGWYDGFEPLILSCDTGYAKPDREFYDIAIKQSGVAPQEILFIDDQDKCLPPAQALGMHTVQAISPEQIVVDTTAVIKRENGIDL